MYCVKTRTKQKYERSLSMMYSNSFFSVATCHEAYTPQRIWYPRKLPYIYKDPFHYLDAIHTCSTRLSNVSNNNKQSPTHGLLALLSFVAYYLMQWGNTNIADAPIVEDKRICMIYGQ
jgi:hypothetical protein